MNNQANGKYKTGNGKFQSIENIAARYDVAPATIRGWVRRGKFPAPVKITARCARWKMEEVEAWEAGKGKVTD